MSDHEEGAPRRGDDAALLRPECPSLVFSEEVVRVAWTDSQEPEFETRRTELRVFGLDLAALSQSEDSEDVDDGTSNSNRSLLLRLAEAMGSGAAASGVPHVLNQL